MHSSSAAIPAAAEAPAERDERFEGRGVCIMTSEDEVRADGNRIRGTAFTRTDVEERRIVRE